MGVFGDFRYSARSLGRTPGLTLALLFTIALGIGSNAAVFGFIRGFVTRDLPIAGIESVVSVFARDAQDAFGPVSYEQYRALDAEKGVFASLGAASESSLPVAIGDRQSVLSIAAVTPELARIFALDLADGVVVSRRVWRSEFDSKASIQGEPIRVDGRDTRVAGIAPEWLDGLYEGRNIDLWVPLDDIALQSIEPASHTLWAIGRLGPGVSVRQAQRALTPALDASGGGAVLPYTGITPELAGGLTRIGRLLPTAAGLVFFIACANVVAFLLSRASARSHETSVRVALGAARGRLARQLLADSVLISIAGGTLGVLLAVWTADIIPALLFVEDAGHLVFSPDPAGILVAAIVCVTLTVACGLVPLFEIRDDSPAVVLRREAAGPSNAMRRLRQGLVVSQMACCCLLVISTGLLVQGFRTALRTNSGNQLGQPLVATLQTRLDFARPDLGLEYFQKAEKAARSIPGISSVAWAGTLPGGRANWQSMRIEPPDLLLDDVVLDVVVLTPESLPQIALPPVAGRMFGGRDTPFSCRVAIVNEAAAEALFEGTAVGAFLATPAGERLEIVGVVAAGKAASPAARARPTVYFYGEQSVPHDLAGPSTFRVSRRTSGARTAIVDVNVVSRTYFDEMGLTPPLAGTLLPASPPAQPCRVGVINQQAAQAYFGGRAVGGAVVDAAGRRIEIVGVVSSTLLRTSQRRIEPALYVPMAQEFLPRMTMILGARTADEKLVAAARRQLEAVPGGGALPVVTTLEAHLSRTALAPERIATLLVGASAVTALALGLLGLYGALADSARQRRRELALRIALGAQSWRVIRQVFVEGLRLASIGTMTGLIGAVAAARWLTRIAPTAAAFTAGTALAALLILLAVVLLASVLPARRALSADPLMIMRDA